MSDTTIFLLEKLVASAPLNRLFVRLTWRNSAVMAYLVAAAFESMRRALPDWVLAGDGSKWGRRMRRFQASQDYRAGDFERAMQHAVEAVNEEVFPPLRCEYLLFVGSSAYELGDFAQALRFFKEALVEWHASWMAKILEPKVVGLGNFMAWAALQKLGEGRAGLPFLFEAAKAGGWGGGDQCENWLWLVREAFEEGHEEYARLGLKAARKCCRPNDPDLQDWEDELTRSGSNQNGPS